MSLTPQSPESHFDTRLRVTPVPGTKIFDHVPTFIRRTMAEGAGVAEGKDARISTTEEGTYEVRLSFMSTHSRDAAIEALTRAGYGVESNPDFGVVSDWDEEEVA